VAHTSLLFARCAVKALDSGNDEMQVLEPAIVTPAARDGILAHKAAQMGSLLHGTKAHGT